MPAKIKATDRLKVDPVTGRTKIIKRGRRVSVSERCRQKNSKRVRVAKPGVGK